MYIYYRRGVILYNILVGCKKKMLWWFLEMCDVLGFEIDRNGVLGKYLGSALPRESFRACLAKKPNGKNKMQDPGSLSNGNLSQLYFLPCIQPRLYSLSLK